MANSNSTLPEGTDTILTGAMIDEPYIDDTFSSGPAGSGTSSGTSSTGAKLEDAKAKVGDATASLRAQATDKARDYALQGKDRAIGALDNVTRLVDDAAATIDAKVGEQYGDYARRASEAVAGFAETLRSKDVDELFADARDVVRKSPAIAIGAAAAIGFVVARLVKAGVPDESTATTATASVPYPTTAYDPPATTIAPTTATTVPLDPAL